MAVRILWGKRKSARNGYNLPDYSSPGYRDPGSDDEDDVFVDDTSLEGVSTASKPLMHPRHRTRVKSRRPDCGGGSACKPLLYFLLMVVALGGLLSLLLYVLNKHRAADQSDQSLLSGAEGTSGGGREQEVLIGCDKVVVEDVWVVGLPKLLTESAFRLVDVNQDGVLDVIFGFATGADGYSIPPVVCDIYFNGTHPCYGGLLALEGATGRELWRHYSQHELFAVTCNADFDGDGVMDCLGAGRAGAMQAVSGRSGTQLWDFVPQEAKIEIMGVYTPQLVPDLDGDRVPDVIVAHGGDPLQDPGSPYRLSGRLMVMSGKTGRVLRWVGVPDNRESYYSPQVYLQRDGTPMVLFGTGGETHGGSLWVISVDHLLKGQITKARALYTDKFKGVMTPPVLLDLTGDGVEDIIICPFNSTVVAIDGASYSILWNATFPQSETYSTPAPGFYNNDDIPDFMVNFAYGPGFPVYYHAKATVLDGKTGERLIDPPIQMSVGAQASPLTVSMEGKGHDLFLYWMADCLAHEGEGGEYKFMEGTNVHEQSRSDFCRLRFKTKGFSKILALSRFVKQPGATVYYSEERKRQERQDWINTTGEALAFLQKHPDHLAQYRLYQTRGQESSSPPGVPSPATATSGRQRAGTLQQLSSPRESYSSQSRVVSPGGGHSLAVKKGPEYPMDNEPRARTRQHPAAGYQSYRDPIAADSNSPYDIPSGLGDSVFTGSDASANQGMLGYPYGLNQQGDYSKYDPESDPRDRYRSEDSGYTNSGYGNRYQPYGNYFQKRNYFEEGDDSSSGSHYPQVPDGWRNFRKQEAIGYSGTVSEETPERAHDTVTPGRTGHKVAGHHQRGMEVLSGRPASHSEAQNGPDGRRKVSFAMPHGTGRPFKPAGVRRYVSGHVTARVSDTRALGRDDQMAVMPSYRARSMGDNLVEAGGTGPHSKPALSGIWKSPDKTIDPRNVVASGDRLDPRSAKGDSPNDPERAEKHEAASGGQTAAESKGRSPPVKTRFMKRRRRHVGPHDDDGLQRLLSTGTVAPSSLPTQHPDHPHSVDVVFATYWFFPAKTQAILPQDQSCIASGMQQETQRFDPSNPYYGMDHDAYEHSITEECLKKSNHQLSDSGTYESQVTYNPYNLHMGQMTVYRLRIKCTCTQSFAATDKKRCARVLPYRQQQWPAYMGRNGDSHWLNPT